MADDGGADTKSNAKRFLAYTMIAWVRGHARLWIIDVQKHWFGQGEGWLGGASAVILIRLLHIVYYIALGLRRHHKLGLLTRTETQTG
jgi:hypothetical protein